MDVTVTHRCHGDNGPPEAPGDGRNLGVFFASLCVVSCWAEYYHGDCEEEEEHAELPHAGLDRETKDPETLRVLGQFEDPEDTEDSGEQEGAFLLGVVTVSDTLHGSQCNEERKDGENVEQVHEIPTESTLGRTRDESEDELDGEPDHADRLHHEESVPIVGSQVVDGGSVGEDLRCVHAALSIGERWNRFGAEADDGD